MKSVTLDISVISFFITSVKVLHKLIRNLKEFSELNKN